MAHISAAKPPAGILDRAGLGFSALGVNQTARAWDSVRSRNPRYVKFPRCALRPKVLCRPYLEEFGIKLTRRAVGDNHLPRIPGVANARGGVDVDTKIVATEKAWSAHMDSDPQARAVTGDLYVRESFLSSQTRFDSRVGVQESGHEAISQPLHNPSLV